MSQWHPIEEGKAEMAFEYFGSILGRSQLRFHAVDPPFLGIPSMDLSGLDSPFLQEEIWKLITDLPGDKSLGPDGFTGLFLQNGLAHYQT